MERQGEAALRNACRGGFVALFAFELVNYAQLLDFTVDFTWLGLLVTSAAVLAALEACASWLSRRGAALPAYAWLLSLGLVGFDAFGDMLHLYGRWTWYDQFGHFLGGCVGVILILQVVRALERTGRWRHPSWVNGLLALGSTTLFGVLYEIEEYLEDVFHASNRLGDGRDTANDLLMNLLGSLAALGLVKLLQRRKSRP